MVIDINLLYTTLEDSTLGAAGSLLQIPNALIFQRVVRRWKFGQTVPELLPVEMVAMVPASAPAPPRAPASTAPTAPATSTPEAQDTYAKHAM